MTPPRTPDAYDQWVEYAEEHDEDFDSYEYYDDYEDEMYYEDYTEVTYADEIGGDYDV